MRMSPPPSFETVATAALALAFEIQRLFASGDARKSMKSFARRGVAPSQGRSACES